MSTRESEDQDQDRSSKFVWSKPGEVLMSQCGYCKHHAGVGQYPVCAAFPGWIPDAIQMNKVDHRQPFEGDQGIRFEPAADVPLEALAPLYRALDAIPS